jgi:hypothetical protein
MRALARGREHDGMPAERYHEQFEALYEPLAGASP